MNTYKVNCQYCGRTFEGNFKGNVLGSCKAHELCCKNNLNKRKYVCDKCGKVFETKIGFVKHKYFQGETIPKIKKQNYTNCVFCGKQILQFGSLKAHEKQCKNNPNRIIPKIGLRKFGNNKTGTSWNKGLTANTDERIRRGLIKAKEKIAELKKQGILINNGKAKTLEKQQQRKRKISETMKKNPLCGGKRQGSGRGKKGWYKGYWCDSSWELAFVIYNLEHSIKFERNKQGFEYEFQGEKHKFYPDFVLEDDTYVEVKGYMTQQNKTKIASFQGTLKVLGKEEIKPYLEYTENKYGKNFIELYEGSIGKRS